MSGQMSTDPYLYFGSLSPTEKQYGVANFIGLALQPRHEREIAHNIQDPLPFAANSIRKIQAEDVLEHLPKEVIPEILDEIYRVLSPSGVFRLSVPDYRSPLLKKRSVYNYRGEVIADVRMGGNVQYDAASGNCLPVYLTNGRAHLWFPTYESVVDLVMRSTLRFSNEINFYHYFTDDETFVLKQFPENQMWVKRAPPNDNRADGKPISIIVDFVK
jgi:SAM-dependent methyltransferase